MGQSDAEPRTRPPPPRMSCRDRWSSGDERRSPLQITPVQHASEPPGSTKLVARSRLDLQLSFHPRGSNGRVNGSFGAKAPAPLRPGSGASRRVSRPPTPHGAAPTGASRGRAIVCVNIDISRPGDPPGKKLPGGASALQPPVPRSRQDGRTSTAPHPGTDALAVGTARAGPRSPDRRARHRAGGRPRRG
jgi:hypothetical protein